jgi:catechol 2,3-dioxygenase-like lactoylglutathione lyase family enzyme
MDLHRGRLIDHVHLRARDLATTKRFYRAVLTAIGRGDAIHETDRHLQCDELWIDAAQGPDSPPGAASHLHLAFQAKDRATVDAFHKAALASGGKDNGAPGERNYHPGYYAAFAIDPDGNNIEAVFHGPAKYSAESVVVSF